MKRILLTILFLHLSLGSLSLFSQEVKEDVQAQLLLKIISFDRNNARFGDPIKIGFSSDSMLASMNKYSKMTVKGTKIETVLLSTLDDIANCSVVYISDNWKSNYVAACQKATEQKVLMFAASFKAVERGEAAVAFKTVKGKAKIVINLKVAKEQDTDFPANLLQLTMVVGNL